MGEVEGDSGGEGRVYGEGEAGEVDEGGEGSGDKGGVAGVLFEALDEAADAVVVAADFLLETFFDQGEERAIAEGDGGAGAELEEVFPNWNAVGTELSWTHYRSTPCSMAQREGAIAYITNQPNMLPIVKLSIF